MTKINSIISYKFDYSLLLVVIFSLTGFIFLSGAWDCDMHGTDSGFMHQTSVPIDECCEMVPVEESKNNNPDDCSAASICCYAQDMNPVSDRAVQTVKKTDFQLPAETLTVIPVISRAEFISAPDIRVFPSLPIYLINSSFLN